MRKIRRIVATLLVVTSVFATSVFAAPSVEDLEDQKDQVQAEMESLQKELAEIMTDMNETEMKLISKGEEIIRATEQLEEAEANEQKQYENMVKRIVAMYENGNSGMLEMIFESGSIAEMIKRMENVQAVHEYDRTELRRYMETKEAIIQLKATLESEQAALETLQKQLETQKKSLSEKIAAKKDEIKNFEQQIAEAARKAAEEAARKKAEEEAKKNQQIIINGNNNSNSGVSYAGSGDPKVGEAIVAAARTYIGVWYAWGGNGYNGIDCSGLTKAAHAAVGIYIDRWSGHQAIGGKAISSLEQAMPGDIICYPGHVAIYIGNYRVIHAPTTGQKVKEASVYMGGTMEITAIRRYW